MSGERPFCGEQTGQVVGSPVTDILAIIGAISTVVSIIVAAKDAATGAAAFTLLGVGAVPLAGVAAGAAVLGVTIYMLYNRCSTRKGPTRCWAGVVNGITDSFNSGWDVVFPSGAMHPRVDIVVKCEYWTLTTAGAGFVACSTSPNGVGSPMIQTFYKSDKVCNAGIGAVIGAAAVVAALVVAAIAIGVIGCATIIFCLLALLIAAIIGAVAALVGAAIGGGIARAVSEDDAPTAGDGTGIAVGDLVTVNGTLLTMEEFELANVGWWAQTTTLHGAVAGQPPYSDVQAAELATDACPIRDQPIR